MIRVTLFVFSLFALWLGIEAVRWVLSPNDEHWGWLLAIEVVGAAFLFWGVVELVGAFTPPSSPWGKFAEKCYPNPAGLDDAAIFFIVVLFPAVLLTLLLRAFGVRGHDT